ncbi:SAR2788 family putative toxin [Bacillus safensis]|uniref:SAR2788 family putative toxin n=1 Tax=Bacillus TaxID=1386 RepID=UPI00041D9602|nr:MULTISPECIES: SAR2788 family putative toxin [Bacillus]TFV07639.1 hypothetical protein E4T85_17120 [Bacillus stratosphericus]MCP1150771.1 SAR2788 family putative toxin [Bacillus sp. 1735sda2]MDQ0819023.1 hypothetical protein [Bacillus pumilus]NRF06926.1 hypothetical protein [Bacillus safensis]QNP16405.1 hypothetical protein H9S87_18150 [Bacillus pumilus]
MNYKKIITILIVTAMVIVNLPINQAEAISESNEVNNQLLENQFDEIKQEVYDELNIDYTDELDINLIDLEEESLHIETTFNSEDLEVKGDLEMSLETEEMNFTSSIIDENGKLINKEYDIAVEEADNETFKATLTDKDSGEKYTVNSEEIEASILPAIILGVIIRTSAKIAFKMYTRSQILRAVTAVTFKSVQLQKKFKHAVDFGVKGSYSKANAKKFETALRNHVSRSSHVYRTKHSGQSGYVMMHLKGNKAAFFKQNGEFITGYKLSTKQKNNYVRIGELIVKR